jgi:peroxiredoxin
MKNINLTLLISIIILTSSCSENNRNEYNLNGLAKNIPNNTLIYLLEDGKSKDSVKIINEKFSFNGIIEEPTEFDLLIKETMDYKSIWLEKGNITFESEKGDFKNAKVIGSQSQIESEKLWKPIWVYRKKRDSLSRFVSDKEVNDSLKKIASFELEKVHNNRLKIEADFIKNNPDSYVSASTLDFYSTSLNKKSVLELYNGFSERLKNSTYGQSIKKYLSLNKEFRIGDKYVDFEMNDINGVKSKLSSFEGKVILLEFWSSGCGPCRKENPNLVKSYEKYNPLGFEVFAVSQDLDKERWLKAIEKDGLSWKHVSELKKKDVASLTYGVNSIPDNFLIDKKGIIIGQNLRGEKLNDKLNEILVEKASL